MKVIEINKLGKELELYTAIDYVGKGFPIIMPNGSKIIKTIRNYVEWLEQKNGYEVVRTPSISNAEIYKIASRYTEEKGNYFIVNKKRNSDSNTQNEIVLKPNAQPFHCSIYNLEQHSYKDLPVKYCETSTIFRNERDIKGIMRTKQITLSDASVFCEFEDIKKEIKDSIMLQQSITKKLGIEINYVVSTWDDEAKENYIGQVNEWNTCYQEMKEVLDELNVEYKTDKNAKMYGPSIKMYYQEYDFSVLQIDFEMPHRFDLKYKNENNEEETPIYIHNNIIGSYENLLSILIDRYRGFFPLTFAPVQVCIVDDGEIYSDYSKKVLDLLVKNNIRAKIDNERASFNDKFNRNLELRIPYIVRISKQELNSETLMVAKLLDFEKQDICNINCDAELNFKNQKNNIINNSIEEITDEEKSEKIKVYKYKMAGNEIQKIKYTERSYKIKDFIEEVTSCQTRF